MTRASKAYSYDSNPAEWAAGKRPPAAPRASCETSAALQRIVSAPVPRRDDPLAMVVAGLAATVAVTMVALVLTSKPVMPLLTDVLDGDAAIEIEIQGDAIEQG